MGDSAFPTMIAGDTGTSRGGLESFEVRSEMVTLADSANMPVCFATAQTSGHEHKDRHAAFLTVISE